MSVAADQMQHDQLLQLLEYNPKRGVFTRRQRRGKYPAGSIVGCVSNEGYVAVKIGEARFLAHRLAWFYMTARWPKAEIDHINRNPADNRWVNLREATSAQNKWNTGPRKECFSRFKGVLWRPSCGDRHEYRRKKPWQAVISFGGKSKSLGFFATEGEAAAAYAAEAKIRHGEFAVRA